MRKEGRENEEHANHANHHGYEETGSTEGLQLNAVGRENLAHMEAAFPPEKTLIVGRPDIVAGIRDTLPFTNAEEYQTTSPTAVGPEDLHGKYVIGNLPLHLECHASSVTCYLTTMPKDLRDSHPEGRYTADETREYTSSMIEYTVKRIPVNPTEFLKEDIIVVTRHQELVDHLMANGIIDENTQVITHLEDLSDVQGKHLIGIASTEMKLVADTVTHVAYDADTGEYFESTTYQVRPWMEFPINNAANQPLRPLAGEYRQHS